MRSTRTVPTATSTGLLRQREVRTAAPSLGEARDDVLPGLRIVGFERGAVIALESTDDVPLILSVHYGGKDWERQLHS